MFEGQGAITSYQILVKSTFCELKIYTENAITNYTASGLSFNTKYNFSVAAVVCGKVGQFSEPLVTNTGMVFTISHPACACMLAFGRLFEIEFTFLLQDSHCPL